MDIIFDPTTGDQPFSIEVGFFDTVLEMKQKIEKYKGIPAASQTLLFNNQPLQDHHEVGFYEVLHNSHITIATLPNQEKTEDSNIQKRRRITARKKTLNVIVVSRCGMREIVVEVKYSDNVRELRKHLEVWEQRGDFPLPEEGYFFIHKQSVMDDDRSFRWHFVKEGDCIEIFNGTVSGESF